MAQVAGLAVLGEARSRSRSRSRLRVAVAVAVAVAGRLVGSLGLAVARGERAIERAWYPDGLAEPRYKAASLVTVRQWLQARGLEDEFVAALSPEAVEPYRRLAASDWIPVGLADQLYAAAAPLLHPRAAYPARLLGTDLAHDHLRGIYRFALRVMTVQFAMDQTGRLWRVYNDTGALEMSRVGPRSSRAVLTGYPGYPPTVRETLAGYIVGTIEVAGALDVRVSVVEGAGGQFAFLATWR